MSSVDSSNTSFGEVQLDHNTYELPMTNLTIKRIKSFYHANPSKVINIRAASNLYMNDDMQYNKAIKDKNESVKLRRKQKTKTTKLNNIEFKMLAEISKEKTAELQSDKLGDYIVPYYDDPKSEDDSKQKIGKQSYNI
jgi:hypothetical protein